MNVAVPNTMMRSCGTGSGSWSARRAGVRHSSRQSRIGRQPHRRAPRRCQAAARRSHAGTAPASRLRIFPTASTVPPTATCETSGCGSRSRPARSARLTTGPISPTTSMRTMPSTGYPRSAGTRRRSARRLGTSVTMRWSMPSRPTQRPAPRRGMRCCRWLSGQRMSIHTSWIKASSRTGRPDWHSSTTPSATTWCTIASPTPNAGPSRMRSSRTAYCPSFASTCGTTVSRPTHPTG